MNNIYSEDTGELRGVFSCKITYWHHLNVDWGLSQPEQLKVGKLQDEILQCLEYQVKAIVER